MNEQKNGFRPLPSRFIGGFLLAFDARSLSILVGFHLRRLGLCPTTQFNFARISLEEGRRNESALGGGAAALTSRGAAAAGGPFCTSISSLPHLDLVMLRREIDF